MTVDGNDAEAMFEATRAARERALAGEGPTLIEAVTMRMHGHAAHDDMKYVPKEQVEEWRKRDPIDRQETRLRQLGVDVDEIRARGPSRDRRRRRGGARRADARSGDRRLDGVFCEGEAEPLGDGQAPWSGFSPSRRGGAYDHDDLSPGDLLRAARRAPRATSACSLMGEDIGVFGGAFKVTDGMFEEFGPDRVMDTPLAESAIIGTAIGAAVVGMRPVCEMQFSDFISCGFDQLVNVAGKMHYRQGLAVPITVRLPSGGGFSGGPFHSQNPEAWFMHAPGIKVVAPSTAEDAKGLLHAAIQDPNPVCFMEHKHLYRRIKGEVPRGGLRDAVHRPGGSRRVATWL